MVFPRLRFSYPDLANRFSYPELAKPPQDRLGEKSEAVHDDDIRYFMKLILPEQGGLKGEVINLGLEKKGGDVKEHREEDVNKYKRCPGTRHSRINILSISQMVVPVWTYVCCHSSPDWFNYECSYCKLKISEPCMDKDNSWWREFEEQGNIAVTSIRHL